MHYIYKIENRLNSKIYIGQTINHEKRMREHIYGRKSKNSIIDKAIKKYGKENFEFEIIDTTCNQEEADFLERKYIKEYSALKPYGYNILIGGRNQQGAWNQRKVYMYDLTGKFIREFDSCSEIERWSDSFYLTRGIADCCKNNRRKYKDRIFRYSKCKVIPYTKPKSERCQTVYQFDKTGKLLSKFYSLSDAACLTKTRRTSISGCLMGTYKTANGFLWSYDDLPPITEVEIQRTQIYQLNDENKIVNEYCSCAQAERILKLRKGAYKTIYSVLNKNKKRYGYYWIRVKDNPVPSPM